MNWLVVEAVPGLNSEGKWSDIAILQAPRAKRKDCIFIDGSQARAHPNGTVVWHFEF